MTGVDFTEEVVKNLDAAADLIEEKGWVQWTQRTRRGFCAVGAIRYASDNSLGWDAADLVSWEAQDLVKAEINSSRPLLWATVAQWNDAPGRTKEEVVQVLRQVAKRAARKRKSQ